jgi:hypothetical protein
MKFSRILLCAAALGAAACNESNRNITDPQFDPSFAKSTTNDAWVSTGKVDIVDPFRADNAAYYKYHAKTDKNGAKGSFSYETELFAGSLVASGVVVCMTVIELPDGTRKARLGGVVTYSNRPEIPEGHEFVWSVTDDNPASGAGETASPLLGLQVSGFAQGYCANGLPYPESPVDGHIHIQRTGNGS